MDIYEKIFKEHGFSKTQQAIISIIGENKTILEIGSSTGYMSKAFLNIGCIVDVVEKNIHALKKLPKGIRRVFNHSIEDDKIKMLLSKDYDFIIMADVLEHLVDPANALKILYNIANESLPAASSGVSRKAGQVLSSVHPPHQTVQGILAQNKNTKLVVSLPNIASWAMRKQLFFRGDFAYQDSGLLDRTHLHFYTVNTLPKLLLENGWRVEKLIGTITRLPFEESLDKIPFLGWFFKKFFYQKLVGKYKNLSYYHFLTVSIKK